MNIGAVDNVKAMALELSFDATGVTTDATKLVHQINNLLAVFAEKAKKNWYLATGSTSLRCRRRRLSCAAGWQDYMHGGA